MAATDEARTVIEAWTGSFTPGDDDLLYDQLADGHLVSLHILRRRLAELTCGPAQAGVDGGYSENYTATINLLIGQIGRLEDTIGLLGLDTSARTLAVTPIVRAGPRVR